VTRFTIMGIPVDPMTQLEAVEWVASAIGNGSPRLIASVNPERIMQARREPEFADILRRADLALADGAGVTWAARRLGHPLPSRVTGVDFVDALAARGAREGWRFFFLGGAPGVAKRAGDVLGQRHPGFVLGGTYAGSPSPADDLATTQAVRKSGANLLFVAYGGGAEEAWLARNLAATGAAVGMGVGGTFDFISGRATRAPQWMRDRGLEWLHRLRREPWRWRRMLVLPRFAALVLLQRS
jgi:N-acetylglucosaminyldiphosphoundecaprenol N-acetyl-beta-D-mannosaminyltransferase